MNRFSFGRSNRLFSVRKHLLLGKHIWFVDFVFLHFLCRFQVWFAKTGRGFPWTDLRFWNTLCIKPWYRFDEPTLYFCTDEKMKERYKFLE